MPIRFRRVAFSERNLMESVYRLRFIVYCLEAGFESPDAYPDGMEYDEFDPHSLHFVALNSSGVIGTIRLIVDSPLGFPLEKNCQVDSNQINCEQNQLAEISRLAVFKTWRCPAVTLGLMREIYRESKRLGIRFWYAAMERKLARLLKNYHLRFDQIGPMVEYHGQRIPFLGDIEKIESTAASRDPERFQFFAHSLEGLCIPHTPCPVPCRPLLSCAAIN